MKVHRHILQELPPQFEAVFEALDQAFLFHGQLLIVGAWRHAVDALLEATDRSG